jgi:hypothetical protein
MAQSPGAESDKSEFQRDVVRNATIQKVVVYYEALDNGGNLADFRVEIDPTKADAVVWNPETLEKVFKKDKTKHNDPPKKPGELPDPIPEINKNLDQGRSHAIREVPAGTCCFINGRWVCWD